MEVRQWNSNSESLHLRQCGPFWINQDHLMSDVKAEDDYEPFYYRLDYEYRNRNPTFVLKSLEHEKSSLLEDLLICGADLGKIFSKHGEDLVLLRLMAIVEEEERIVKEKGESHCLNEQLLTELNNLVKKYKQRVRQPMNKNIISDLPSILNLINSISEIEVIKKQLDAIKQTQSTIFQNSQFVVKN